MPNSDAHIQNPFEAMYDKVINKMDLQATIHITFINRFLDG